MWNEPVAEWRRLTEHYRQMYDEELIRLNDSLSELTEVAQQVLHEEMKKRGLSEQRDAGPEGEKGTDGTRRPAALHWEGDYSSLYAEDEDHESGLPREYSWKVLLCECEEREQAWQLATVLKNAGIDSWIDGPRTQHSQDTRFPRILVAADQLDRAREIAALPIPQSIIDESQEEVPEFELPRCPRCRAADPILESVDPANSWHCESCGFDWADRVEELKPD